jgi:hypothetical protein
MCIMKKIGHISLISCALLILVTSLTSAAPLSAVDPGTSSSNIFLMNLGSSQSNIVVSFIDPTTGSTVDQISDTLDPKIGKMILASDLSISSGWIGSGVVASNEPTAAIANILFDNVNGTTADKAAAYTGISEPDNQVYLPDLFRRSDRFTRIAVQNTGGSQATVYMHYYDREGVETIPTDPADRVFTIESQREKTIDLPDVGVDFSGTLGIGSLYMTSTQEIAAMASLHWPDKVGAYSGVSAGDTTLWFPGCIRWPHATPTQFSSMIVQNAGTADATVRFEILDRNNSVNFVFTDTIGVGVAYGFNFKNVGASMDQTTWDDMIDAVKTAAASEGGWKGTVKAISTNGQPLVGAGIFFAPTGDNIMFNAINNSDATTGDLAFPVSKRYLSGTSNEQFTIHIVQNLSNAQATVNVSTYDRYGVQLTGPTAVDIPANGSVAFNLQKEIDLPQSDLDDLGTGFSGSMYVTGDGTHEIIGVAYQYFPRASKSMGYNAFVVP